MLGLIQDRTKANVERLKTLSAKGWDNMTASERAEWLGDPSASLVSPVNLLPSRAHLSSGVACTHDIRSLTVTATAAGANLYGVFVVGDAANFVGKKLTLSLNGVKAANGGTPRVAAYWYDENGSEYAGASLSAVGGVTFTPSSNTANRAKLALFVYVAANSSVGAGASVRYLGLMLERGSVRHGYVPYAEIHPTYSTLGAYNYTDLNRVEMVVQELSNRLGLGLTTKTDWNVWDFPSSRDMRRYLSNIQAVREKYIGEEKIPEAPTSIDKFTYSEANDIEKILAAVYEMIGVDRASVLGTMVLGMCTLGQSEELL